ncbi:MAG: NAD(P)H-dependent oxidoreductase subunit E [Chitinivibrionales bacterium]|nr:NAD(P)H-dependent oxidoreductase subunit E [Chitinivibrionales bacterium]
MVQSKEQGQETLVSEREQKLDKSVVAMLDQIQVQYGYLPVHEIETVAQKTGKTLVDVYGVATFYKAFSLKPRGRHCISVCLGTACHVRGGAAIAEEFERLLKVQVGQTTDDKEFSLETVACLGACALGPIVVIDGHYFSKVSRPQVADIIEKVRKGLDTVSVVQGANTFPVEVSCSRCNHSLMDSTHEIDGYPSIRVTISSGRNHGWLRLSSLYGSYKSQQEFPSEINALVNFFCPYCHSELKADAPCTECGAPMVPMIVRGGGVVKICSRFGCHGHMLDLDCVNG